MNPQDAIDFSREAIKTCLLVGGPILLASLLIGLLVGVLQAMTQVQDQTVSFVPKILLLIVMIGLCLPWLTDQMLEFAKLSFEKPMTQWAGSSMTSAPKLFPKSRLKSDPESASTIKVASLPEAFVPAPSAAIQLASVASAGFETTISPHAESESERSGFEFPDERTPPNFEIPRRQTPSDDDLSPMVNSPFILPHYRTVPAQKSDIGG